MRRLLVPVLILFVLLLSACGGGGDSGSGGGGTSGGATKGLTGGRSYIDCPSGGNTTAAAPESGSVTLNVAGATSSPAEENLVKQNIQKFEQSHPNIKIEWQNISQQYPEKMRANIASGNVPDVFYLAMDMASDYIPNNKLLNLTPYMNRDNVKPEDFYTSLMSPFSCKSGQLYGIAKDWNTLGVFYNTDMFKEKGIPAPKAGWTWNDMRDVAKKLTTPKSGNKQATYGITLAPDASRWGAFLFAAGGQMLNDDGTKSSFNSQAGIDSLNFYTGFTKDGSSVIPGKTGAGWAGDAFAKGYAGMALEGGWLIPYLANFPKIKYDIAPLPVGPNGKEANLIYTVAWGAYANTKHPDASWQFIKYMTGTEAQRNQLQAGFALPSIKTLANDPYFKDHPGFKVMFDAAEHGFADNYGPRDSVIHSTLQDAIEKVMDNKADAATALKQAETTINNELLS